MKVQVLNSRCWSGISTYLVIFLRPKGEGTVVKTTDECPANTNRASYTGYGGGGREGGLVW